MKTRIKVKEYNNGNIEYICQKNIHRLEYNLFFLTSFIFATLRLGLDFEFKSFLGLFFNITSIFTFIVGIKIFIDRYENMDIYKNNCYYIKGAIFNNMDDAKKFIDEELQKKVNGDYEKWLRKTKSTTYLKYP